MVLEPAETYCRPLQTSAAGVLGRWSRDQLLSGYADQLIIDATQVPGCGVQLLTALSKRSGSLKVDALRILMLFLYTAGAFCMQVGS
jgi:hypothetical protein